MSRKIMDCARSHASRAGFRRESRELVASAREALCDVRGVSGVPCRNLAARDILREIAKIRETDEMDRFCLPSAVRVRRTHRRRDA
jgi:hypothetical protein